MLVSIILTLLATGNAGWTIDIMDPILHIWEDWYLGIVTEAIRLEYAGSCYH
jgi:hypothetical protein